MNYEKWVLWKVEMGISIFKANVIEILLKAID